MVASLNLVIFSCCQATKNDFSPNIPIQLLYKLIVQQAYIIFIIAKTSPIKRAPTQFFKLICSILKHAKKNSIYKEVLDNLLNMFPNSRKRNSSASDASKMKVTMRMQGKKEMTGRPLLTSCLKAMRGQVEFSIYQ